MTSTRLQVSATTPSSSSFGRGRRRHQSREDNNNNPSSPHANHHYNNNKKHYRHRPRQNNNRHTRKEWLQAATQRLLQSEPGSLTQGKWHEVTSLFHGWATLAKSDKEAPLRMEALLKRLLQEQQAQQQEYGWSGSVDMLALLLL